MRINVIDIGRIEFRMRERRLHRAKTPVAFRGRCGDMVGIARQAVSGYFGINLCATLFRVFIFFKHHNAGALAHDKTVTAFIPRARCLFRRIVIAGRQCACRRKSGEANAADGRFRTACHHHVGIAELDQARGIADGVRSGRACGDYGMVRAFEAEFDRHLAGRQVDQACRNKKWADALGAFFMHQQHGFFDRVQPADTRTDHHARTLFRFFIFRHPTGILYRLRCCSHGEMDEVIHLFLLFGSDPVVGIEFTRIRAAFHFTRNARGQVGNIAQRNGAKTRFRRKNIIPRRFNTATQRRNQTQTCNDDSSHDMDDQMTG